MSIEDGDVLVIGGCVDRPTRPGESRRRAESIAACVAARIPIREVMGLTLKGMSQK